MHSDPTVSKWWPVLGKTLVSGFILLNLATMLLANLPEQTVVGLRRAARDHLSDRNLVRARQGEYGLRAFGHVTGVGARWHMFGWISEEPWLYDIHGVYEDGREVRLPLAFQADRDFWQRYAFDFKEGRFLTELLQSPEGRRAYAHYLARQYPYHGGAALETVVFVREHREVLPPDLAKERETHLGGLLAPRKREAYQVRPPSGEVSL